MRLKELRKDPNADAEALEFLEYLLKVGEGRNLSDERTIGLPRSVNIVSAPTPDDTARLLADNVLNRIETR